jgi:hypothetical protein
MTPFAVMQRAARLAPELDKILINHYGVTGVTLTTRDVLEACYAAGLTIDAETAQPSYVKAALDKMELSDA